MSRRQNDFYETEDKYIRPFFDELENLYDLRNYNNVCEPSAGTGSIIKELRKRNWPKKITAIEIDETHKKELDKIADKVFCPYNFMTFANKYTGIKQYDIIIGNPPFSLAEIFVEKSFDLLRKGGLLIFLLEASFAESKGRIKLWKKLNKKLSGLFPLSNRPSFTNDGKTGHAMYSWFVWKNVKQVKQQHIKIITST